MLHQGGFLSKRGHYFRGDGSSQDSRNYAVMLLYEGWDFMALNQVILDIAGEMEKICCEGKETVSVDTLRSFVSFLRIAVKSSPESEQGRIDPQVQHFLNIQKAREEFRREKGVEEGSCMRQVVGGSLDGDLIPSPTAMPVLAKTSINGEVYCLKEDGKLHLEEIPSKEGSPNENGRI